MDVPAKLEAPNIGCCPERLSRQSSWQVPVDLLETHKQLNLILLIPPLNLWNVFLKMPELSGHVELIYFVLEVDTKYKKGEIYLTHWMNYTSRGH